MVLTSIINSMIRNSELRDDVLRTGDCNLQHTKYFHPGDMEMSMGLVTVLCGVNSSDKLQLKKEQKSSQKLFCCTVSFISLENHLQLNKEIKLTYMIKCFI